MLRVDVITGDVLTCHIMKSTGVANAINNGLVSPVLHLLLQLIMGHFSQRVSASLNELN